MLQILQNNNLVRPAKMRRFIRDLDKPGRALKEIRNAIAVWHYLNNAEVKQSFVQIERDVRTQLEMTQNEWAEHEDGYKVRLVDAWHEFFDDMIPYQVDRTSKWVHENIEKMTEIWASAVVDEDLQKIVLGSLTRLGGFAHAIINYDLDDFHQGPDGL